MVSSFAGQASSSQAQLSSQELSKLARAMAKLSEAQGLRQLAPSFVARAKELESRHLAAQSRL